MSFPRYPEYKGSGVEWLAEVPVHGPVIRVKREVFDTAKRIGICNEAGEK